MLESFQFNNLTEDPKWSLNVSAASYPGFNSFLSSTRDMLEQIHPNQHGYWVVN